MYKPVHNTLFLAVCLFGLFMMVSPTYAVLTATDVGNGFIWAVSQLMLGLSRLAVAVAVFALELFIEIAGYNGYSSAPPVLIGWFMVRDLANMFFVIMLLVIAFGTILGLEQYEWKKTLGKLVLAAVLINFSKLIAQLIIDAAHVFTITFLNAIASTAGGNLISMFHFDKLFNILPNWDASNGGSLRLDVFGASALIITFSLVALASIGAYLVIMLARLVMLWMLIILSPLAYLLSVIPQTQGYAQEYWKEFMNHVLVAPLMVFFLWLAFASMGSGTIAQRIGTDFNQDFSSASDASNRNFTSRASNIPNNPNVAITEAGTWQNMASFLIAVGFLFAGLDRVSKLGVQAGGVTSSITSFGKKVLTIATGVALGIGAAKVIGKATVGAGKFIGETALSVPGDYINREKAAFKAHLLSTGRRDKNELKGWEKPAGWFVRNYVYRKKSMKKMQNAAEEEEKHVYDSIEASAAGWKMYKFDERDREGKRILGVSGDTSELILHNEEENAIYRGEEKIANLGNRSLSQVRDIMGKKEKERTDEEKNILAEITGNVGFDDLVIGLPRDRFLEGKLIVQKERKAQKDAEFQGLGGREAFFGARIKEGKRKNTKPDGSGTIGDEIARRELRAKGFKADKDRGLGDFRQKQVEDRTGADALARIARLEANQQNRERATEKQSVKALAKEYRNTNQSLRAIAVERSFADKWQKKDAELFSTLFYADRMALSAALSTQLGELGTDIAQKIAEQEANLGREMTVQEREDFSRSDERLKELFDKKNQLIRQQALLQIANNNADEDAESSRDGFMTSLQSLGWFDQEDPEADDNGLSLTRLDSAENRLRAQLSSLLGRVVGVSKEEIQEAVHEVGSAYESNDERQAAYRSLISSQKKAAISGNLGMVGLMGEFVDKDGNLRVTFGRGLEFERQSDGTLKEVQIYDKKATTREQNVYDEDGNKVSGDEVSREYKADISKGMYSYFYDRNNIRKTNDISSHVTIGAYVDEDGERQRGIVDINDDNLASLLSLYGGKDSRTIQDLSSAMWTSWKSLLDSFEHLEETQQKNIVSGISDMIRSVRDKNAADALVESMQPLIEKLGKHDTSYQEQFDKALESHDKKKS